MKPANWFPQAESWSANQRRLALLLIASAPLALWLGWQWREPAAPELLMRLDRDQYLQHAHAEAARRGVDTRGWKGYTIYRDQAAARAYWQGRAAGDPPELRLAPAMVVEVALLAPDYTSRVLSKWDGYGRMLQYAESGAILRRAAGVLPSEQEIEAKARGEVLGDYRGAYRLGAPQVESFEGPAGQKGRRWTWMFENWPHTEYRPALSAAALGERLVEVEIGAPFQPAFVEKQSGPRQTRAVMLSLIGLTALIPVVIYALIRFGRRAADKEAPRGRALFIFCLLLLFGLLMALLDPDYLLAGVPLDKLDPSLRMTLLLSIAGVSLAQGILVGLAYASSEGDLREFFPGKLTSADALLTGRWFTRNIGAAIASGGAFAAWVFLVSTLLHRLLAPGEVELSQQMVMMSFSRGSWAVLLANLPLSALVSVTGVLLLPLMVLWRNVRKRYLRAALLLACALLTGAAASGHAPLPALLLGSGIYAATLLLPFFLFDLLAAVVAVASYSLLFSMAPMTQHLSLWEPMLPVVGAFSAVTAAFAALAWWKGRTVTDEEVRPQYARNVAFRQALEADVRAARAAQQLLMPRALPALEGVSLAATCIPAGNVGGDYFEFFPLRGGRLGFVLAEGGNDGLASALTIALAKGFLSAELEKETEPAKVMPALESIHGDLLRRGSSSTSLVYGLIDPAAARLRWARVGEYPRLFLLVAGEGTNELQPGEAVLPPGAHVVGCTDGVPRRLAAMRREPLEDLLRKTAAWQASADAAAVDRALREILVPSGGELAGLQDDLTFVVLNYAAPPAYATEGVA